MAIDSKTLSILARNPTAYVRFCSTGDLPKLSDPKGPLITLLRSIYPHERLRILNLRVGPELGYQGMRTFQNAAQALNWVRPQHKAQHHPCDSSQIARFTKQLSIDDLSQFAVVPPDVAKAWKLRNKHI